MRKPRRFRFVEPAGYVLGEDVGATDTVNEYWIEKVYLPYLKAEYPKAVNATLEDAIDEFCINHWAWEI